MDLQCLRGIRAPLTCFIPEQSHYFLEALSAFNEFHSSSKATNACAKLFRKAYGKSFEIPIWKVPHLWQVFEPNKISFILKKINFVNLAVVLSSCSELIKVLRHLSLSLLEEKSCLPHLQVHRHFYINCRLVPPNHNCRWMSYVPLTGGSEGPYWGLVDSWFCVTFLSFPDA